MSPLAVLSRGLSVIWDYWLSRTRDGRVGTGRTAAAPLCTCSRPAGAGRRRARLPAAELVAFCVTRGRLPMAGSLGRGVLFFFSLFFFSFFLFLFFLFFSLCVSCRCCRFAAAQSRRGAGLAAARGLGGTGHRRSGLSASFSLPPLYFYYYIDIPLLLLFCPRCNCETAGAFCNLWRGCAVICQAPG